ncbi:MAG: PilZ domain-containing protein [Pseudomonadota bacterium]
MHAPSTERRHFPRLSNQASLFLHAIDSPPRTLPCIACDISVRGIQLQTEQPLAENVPVELWIKLDDQPGTFLLRGQVRWSLPVGKHYLLGIALDADQHDLDMESWAALLMPLPDKPVR